MRSGSIVKVNCHCLGDLLVQIVEALPLRCDAAAVPVIPPCHQPARLLVTLDLKGDFFHDFSPIIPYWRGGSPGIPLPYQTFAGIYT